MRPTLPCNATREARRGPFSLCARADGGFTLIEVLVSALLVALLGAVAATALIAGAGFSGNQRFRAQADQLLAQDQERLRGLPDEQLSGLSQTRTVTLPSGNTFTVLSTASFTDTTGSSSCGQSAVNYYKTTSTVSWAGGSFPAGSLVSDSVLSRPVGGGLVVQVTDQTLAPLSGVTVNANGPSSQYGRTDAAGCVAFAGLTPGLYTTTLSTPGWVDPNGDSTPQNATATVTASGVAKPNGFPFHMGWAGHAQATFAGALGAGGEADAVSWVGTGALLGMSGPHSTLAQTDPVSAPQTTITTAAALFPFDMTASGPASYDANYAVWAGRCPQMAPPAPTRVGVAPGALGQGTVIEPQLYVPAVTYYNGTSTTAVIPHLLLSFQSGSGTSCTYKWYPNIAAVTSVPASGWLAHPGQPYVVAPNKLTLCADYNNHQVTSPTTFTNSSFTATNPAPPIAITSSSSSGKC